MTQRPDASAAQVFPWVVITKGSCRLPVNTLCKTCVTTRCTKIAASLKQTKVWPQRRGRNQAGPLLLQPLSFSSTCKSWAQPKSESDSLRWTSFGFAERGQMTSNLQQPSCLLRTLKHYMSWMNENKLQERFFFLPLSSVKL